MRVLTVANHLGAWGGMERSQLTMCRALAQRGHRIDLVYATPGDLLDDWQEVADTITTVPGTLPRTRAPFTTSYRVLDAAQEIRHLQPDVVYVYRYLDLPFASAVGRLTRAPVVLRLCHPPPPRLPFVIRRSLPNVALTLAVSFDTALRWRGTAAARRQRGGRAHRNRHGVLPSVVRPRPGGPPGRRSASDPDDFMVLYAGRISPEKGLDVLMEAARLLSTRLPHAHLVLAGGPTVGTDPDESARYLAELRARSGPSEARWLGRDRDIVPLIAAADVAVAPSVGDEPFSRSVIESLACGVPVVASRTGGNPEILVDWLARFLVPPKDPGALVGAIRDLEGWRRTDPSLGDRCRQAVRDRLALGREVDTVEAALASVARHREADPLMTYL